MDRLFLTILNMSLTGAFVIAAICLVRVPLRKAPKLISYFLWAIAGFRLVFPFTIESIFSLIPFKAQPIPLNIAVQQTPHMGSAAPPSDLLTASVNPLQIWTTLGAYVWLIGLVVLFVYGVVSYLLLKRKICGARYVDRTIYQADNIQSPFVLGFFQPRIYLPTGMSEHEKSYIILHERTHIRRYDHMIKLAAYFVLCLHWFNPLVWVAFLLMGVDMEMSCDERVLKEMGDGIKKDYSLSLLSMATQRHIIGGYPLAFGEGGIKGRVKNVLNFKKPSRILVTLAVALVVALSVGFAVNRAGVQSPLQEVTGATKGQAELIESQLAASGISYKTIASSVNPITEDMGTNWQAYDLFAEDGSVSVLILRKSDHTPTAVLNYAGHVISGSIDPEITPALFIDGKNKFEIGSIEDESGILMEDDRVIYVSGRKAFHMTPVGYDAWVAAGKKEAEVDAFSERVLYTPLGKGPDEQMYMNIESYRAWVAAGETDAQVYDFAIPYADLENK